MVICLRCEAAADDENSDGYQVHYLRLLAKFVR